jgi:hypothetical protein
LARYAERQAGAPAPFTRAWKLAQFLKLRRDVEVLDHVSAMIGKHHRGNGYRPNAISNILMALSAPAMDGSMPC